MRFRIAGIERDRLLDAGERRIVLIHREQYRTAFGDRRNVIGFQ